MLNYLAVEIWNWPFDIGWHKDFIVILAKFDANLIALKFCERISGKVFLLLNLWIYDDKIIIIQGCSIYVSKRPNFIFYNSCKILDFARYLNDSTIIL